MPAPLDIKSYGGDVMADYYVDLDTKKIHLSGSCCERGKNIKEFDLASAARNLGFGDCEKCIPIRYPRVILTSPVVDQVFPSAGSSETSTKGLTGTGENKMQNRGYQKKG